MESNRLSPFAKRQFDKSRIVIILLSIGLVVAVGGIIYQRRAANQPAQHPAAQNMNQSYKAAFASFLTALKSSNVPAKDAHQELSNYIRSLDKSSFPNEQELKQFAATNDIPNDHKYFFNECLPAYSHSLGDGGMVFKDPHVILSLPYNAGYKARLILNSNSQPAESMYQALDPQGSQNRLVMSGAYSSPYNLPAGLTVDKGEVVNPAIQNFDGLLLVWPDGRLQISHINSLQSSLRSLRIKSSFPDYMNFLKMAEQERLSVLQSNLLINDGEILVKDDPGLKKLPRRVIFQTADGGIHVYDSSNQEQTLFETARHIREHYQAERALNLETGSYSFCTVNKQNQLNNRSNFKPGTIISNFIVIDF